MIKLLLTLNNHRWKLKQQITLVTHPQEVKNKIKLIITDIYLVPDLGICVKLLE